MKPQAGMNLEVQNDQALRDVAQASAGPSVGVQGVLFAFFVLSRAAHSIIIDATKVDKQILYSHMSVPLVETVFTLVAGQLMALANGGLREWKDIWKPAPMKVFSVIGFIYAIGDYLEMASMGVLEGATYQVLSQSKLLITALMMWGIKGSKQNALQWNILALVVVSMIVYMITSTPSGNKGDEENGSGVALWAYVLVLGKVIFSCLAAVLSDKYMKDFKNEPIYMQLVQFKVAWFATLLVVTFSDGATWHSDFFSEWNGYVVGAAASFTVKGWSTMYLLAILDSVLKNIGEASAILVTYGLKCLLPNFTDRFENDTFLCVMVVILSVTAYVGSKGISEKARLHDAQMAQLP